MDRDEAIQKILSGSRTVQMPKQELLDQMIRHIKTMPLTAEDTLALYNAIVGRMVYKRCHICLKPGLEIEGAKVFPNGDLSKPKVFVCKGCK